MPTLKRQPAAWESLADLETGRLERITLLDKLRVPDSVRMEGSDLCFGWESHDVKVREGLLERFLGLRSASGFLKFAQRFGPIGTPEPRPYSREEPDPGPVSRREALNFWRDCQWEFDKLLAVAAAVREGEKIDTDPFVEFRRRGITVEPGGFLSDIGRATPPSWTDRSAQQRLILATSLLVQRVNAIVESCGLRPALQPVTSRSTLRLELVFADKTGQLSLFGALVTQLLASSIGTGFVACSNCGSVFVPRRRHPAFGRRRYCRECGNTAARRDAKADYRKREREKLLAKSRSSK